MMTNKMQPQSLMMLRGSGDLQAVKSTTSGGESGFGAYQSYANQIPRELRQDDSGRALAYATSVWAFRCVFLRASKLSTIKHMVVDRNGKVIDQHPLTRALEATYRRTKKNFLFEMEADLCIHGELYIEKQLQAFTYMPYGLRRLNPLATEPYIAGGEILHFDYYPSSYGEPFQQLDPDDVLFYATHNPLDDYRGLAPMTQALDSVNVDRAIQAYNRSFFLNDGRPDGIVTPKTALPEGPWKALVNMWNDTFKGPNKRGKTAFVNAPLDWIAVQREPVPAHVEIDESNRRKICAAFGVPLSIAGAWDDAQYQSSPEQRRSLYEETVLPQAQLIADLVNSELMPFFDPEGYGTFKFDTDAVMALIEDRATKTTMVNSRVAGATLTINEARTALGDAPIDGGDVFLIPAGMIAVRQADLGKLPDILSMSGFGAGFDPNSIPLPDAALEPALPTAPAATPLLPAVAETSIEAVAEELKRWRKVAAKWGKARALKFESTTIPEEQMRTIKSKLAAMSNDDFADREMLLRAFQQGAGLDPEDAQSRAQRGAKAATLKLVPMVTADEIKAAREALKAMGLTFDDGSEPDGEPEGEDDES